MSIPIIDAATITTSSQYRRARGQIDRQIRLTDLTVANGRGDRVLPENEIEIIPEDDTRSAAWPTTGKAAAASLRRTPTSETEVEMNPSEALSDERVLHNNGKPVVAASDVTRRYGEGDTAVDALRGVSLDVARGKLTAVMGPSGSGKSTLMHILAGLDKPTSGTVSIDGTEVTTLGDTALTKLRRRHIGFVFQFFNLLPMLSAEENVRLPLTIAGTKPEKAWFENLLQQVGLTDRRSHRPSELSGGQQQRVAIARALVSQPTVVFADEPTGNLDSATSGEILQLMRRSVDELGQTTVMVTHDLRAAAIADRILFLADGLIVKDVVGASQTDVIAAMEELTLA